MNVEGASSKVPPSRLHINCTSLSGPGRFHDAMFLRRNSVSGNCSIAGDQGRSPYIMGSPM
jgi:hypothetical protein